LLFLCLSAARKTKVCWLVLQLVCSKLVS
jgi:hypothetical protein